MSIVNPIRTTTERRYNPAFFQHGRKVLTPVHGYGYCSKETKGDAFMTKRIYMPHLNISDCFSLDQRVGVCVDQIASGTEYWSDGVITAISDTDHYIEVLIDDPIDIPWGGDCTIDFINAIIPIANAHLWQTVDGKSYVTSIKSDITDSASQIYAPSDFFISSKLFFVTSVDKYVPITTTRTKRYFILQAGGSYSDFDGSYRQKVSVADPTNEYVVYSAAEDSRFCDAIAPMLWDRLGHMDGTILGIDDEEDVRLTWFKDRPTLFTVEGESIPAVVEPPSEKTVYPSTVVYVCNPFNVSHDSALHRFVLSVPSYTNDIQMPVDSNYWATGTIDNDTTEFECDFRPAVDEDGTPYVKNFGNSADLDCTEDYTLCVYDVTDMVYEKFTGSTFDVFINTPESEADLFVGGQNTQDEFICDIGTNPTSLESAIWYASTDTDYINKATYPVMLSKMTEISAAAPNRYTRSVGSWDDAEYFNGMMWFACNNVLKPSNALLEFDPANTIEIPSAVLGLKALANQLFVFAADGIWTVNLNNEVEFLSSIQAKAWATVAESMYIVDHTGKIYNTEFTPIPARDQRKITENPYLVMTVNTAMIKDIADQWEVFDIASCYDMLWVASNHGLWAMESSTKAWFKVCNDVFLRLVVVGNELFGMTGDMDTENEMNAIDLIPLLNVDKGVVS